MKLMLRSLRRTLPIYRNVYKTTRALNIYRDKESNSFDKNDASKRVQKIIIGATVIGFLGYQLYDKKGRFVYAAADDNIRETVGKFKEGLTSYSLGEVRQHDTEETRIWVTYKEGVYDITDFIESHPGGQEILMAAGASVEPFWALYAIHESPLVYKLLEKHRIGNLRKEDVSKPGSNADYYTAEPKRNAALQPRSDKPFNAEIPPSRLIETFFTSNDLFFVRNHLPVPDIDPATYELEIELEGKNKTVSYTLDQLKKLPKTTITATLMCAGNRRSEMAKVKPVNGLSWGQAAISNAKWTGVRLRDLLLAAGVSEDDQYYQHVQFEGTDYEATGKTYGASIPIWKALDKRGDVLLAYEMNGGPIPRDHGFPVRAVVPGVAGARSVKWISRVVVSKEESDSHWQQKDYKGFSPSTNADDADYSKAPSIQEVPVTSAICLPADGDTVKVANGRILLKGYAFSGGGQKIIRVDVTGDEGKTWRVANIDCQDSALPPQHWAWTLWSIELPVPKESDTVEIWVKAVDSSYNTQPESFANIYNFRGVLNNAYHRIKVSLKQ